MINSRALLWPAKWGGSSPPCLPTPPSPPCRRPLEQTIVKINVKKCSAVIRSRSRGGGWSLKELRTACFCRWWRMTILQHLQFPKTLIWKCPKWNMNTLIIPQMFNSMLCLCISNPCWSSLSSALFFSTVIAIDPRFEEISLADLISRSTEGDN